MLLLCGQFTLILWEVERRGRDNCESMLAIRGFRLEVAVLLFLFCENTRHKIYQPQKMPVRKYLQFLLKINMPGTYS